MNVYTIPFQILDEVVIEAESIDEAICKAVELVEQEFFNAVIIIEEDLIECEGMIKQ